MLVPFNTPALYGMERAVIEIFSALRPEVEPHFVLAGSVRRLDLPIYHKILEEGFSHSFFSDRRDWPKIAAPRSPKHLWELLHALTVGNLDVLRASKGQDAVYLASIHYEMYALLAAAAVRRRGGRVLFHFHDLGANGPWDRVLCGLRSLLTHVVHNTAFSRDQILQRLPALKQLPNVVIPLAPHIRYGGAHPEVEAQLRGKTNLVFVGQVAYHKGADLLLEALELISDDYPELRLHLLGAAGNPEYGMKIQALLERPRLREKCIHWGYRGDVHAFLAAAYLHVQPSRPSVFQESFGRGAVEAMALGVPTVCLESGALQAIVRDGETGRICREETPEALARTLRQLLDSPAEREAMGRACLAEYASTYTPERVQAQWRAFLGLSPAALGTTR